MSRLLCKPIASGGKIHDIPLESAGWKYAGFALHLLKEGDRVSEMTRDREAILVMIEGWVDISSGSQWEVVTRGDCALAVCTAPGHGGHAARLLDSPKRESRGKGANTRHIHSIAMEEADVADSLLVTEVITPSGNWSSYPPHRHDEDDFPIMIWCLCQRGITHAVRAGTGVSHIIQITTGLPNMTPEEAPFNQLSPQNGSENL